MAIQITQLNQLRHPHLKVFIAWGLYRSFKVIEYRNRKFLVLNEENESEGVFTAKQFPHSLLGKAMHLGKLFAFHSDYAEATQPGSSVPKAT